jgi:hypothetical protein
MLAQVVVQTGRSTLHPANYQEIRLSHVAPCTKICDGDEDWKDNLRKSNRFALATKIA